jgi:hypothetical protein
MAQHSTGGQPHGLPILSVLLILTQSDGRGVDFELPTEIIATSTAIVPLRIIGIVPDRNLNILRDF